MSKKSKTKFGMLSVKAGIDNNPNPTQADRIAGATKKMKRGGKVTGRSIGPAGASIVSDDGKNIKQGDINKKLELITMDYLKSNNKYEISLIFTNNAYITLSTEIIEVTLDDQNKID